MSEKKKTTQKKKTAPSKGLHQTEMGGKIDRNKKKKTDNEKRIQKKKRL